MLAEYFLKPYQRTTINLFLVCLALGTDYWGPASVNIAEIPNIPSPELCYEQCKLDTQCLHFTFITGSNVCITKNDVVVINPTVPYLISGPGPCT